MEEEKREQDELEEKLEELEEEVEQIKSALDELEPEERIPEAYIEKRDGAVTIHWLEADLPSRFDAQNLFNAHYASSLLYLPVKHGDVIAVDGDCRWFGMCVVANELHQFNPGGENSVEFIIWGGGDCDDCECDPVSLGVSLGTRVGVSLGTSWGVSLGSCVWFNNTMSISIYSSDSTGTTLLTKLRAFTLNKCGEVIHIGEEEEHQLLIPCCGEEDGCDDDFLEEYTLTDANGTQYTLNRHFPNCNDWFSLEKFGSDPEWHYWSMHRDAVGDFAVSGNQDGNGDGFPCQTGAGPKSDGNDTVPTGTYECLNNLGEPQGTIATVSVP